VPEPPEPKRGGTFFYCPWTSLTHVNGVTRWSCGWDRARWAGSRFRTAAAYRRHWRRVHT
jgi:hypothetical protein